MQEKLHKLFFDITVIANCDIDDGREIGKHIRRAIVQGLKNIIVLDVDLTGTDSVLPMTEEELTEEELTDVDAKEDG